MPGFLLYGEPMSDFSWPIPFTPLSNERVALRALHIEDADAVYEAAIDPQMQRFTPIPLEYSRSMAVEFINKHSRPQSSLVWAIELADNPGRYAGNIMLKLQSEKNRNVLADYNTAPWARRRGTMTQALQLVLDHAFNNYIHRVELRATLDNTPSRTVAERNGFVFEGVARDSEYIRGDFHDVVVYAKIASDHQLMPPKAYNSPQLQSAFTQGSPVPVRNFRF